MATIKLIVESILALGDRTGSSVPALNKYLENEKKTTIKKHIMKAALKRGVESGTLVMVKSSYKLSPEAKKAATAKKKAPKAAKKTAAAKKAPVKKAPTKKKAPAKKTSGKKTSKKTTATKKTAAPKKKKTSTKKATTTTKTTTKKTAKKQ